MRIVGTYYDQQGELVYVVYISRWRRIVLAIRRWFQ